MNKQCYVASIASRLLCWITWLPSLLFSILLMLAILHQKAARKRKLFKLCTTPNNWVNLFIKLTATAIMITAHRVVLLTFYGCLSFIFRFSFMGIYCNFARIIWFVVALYLLFFSQHSPAKVSCKHISVYFTFLVTFLVSYRVNDKHVQRNIGYIMPQFITCLSCV